MATTKTSRSSWDDSAKKFLKGGATIVKDRGTQGLESSKLMGANMVVLKREEKKKLE